MIAEDKTVWPGWKTVEEYDSGTSGTVYIIERSMGGRVERAAVKRISIPKSRSEIQEKRSQGYSKEEIADQFFKEKEKFEEEYMLMAEMKGAVNIVHCEDLRSEQHDDGIGWDIYIKMELLTPLLDVLSPSYEENQVIKVGRDICRALVMCENAGIIHRDIKPQNIFVSKDGTCKLGDFGVARVAQDDDSATKGTGTYRFMAPEVYTSEKYGYKADQYSLGMVLYWMMNKYRSPFLPLPPEKVSEKQQSDARDRRIGGAALPAPANGSKELQDIVLKACAYNPEDRYESAAEMLAALNGISVNNTIDVKFPNPVNEQKGNERELFGLDDPENDETISAHGEKTEAVRKKPVWPKIVAGVAAVLLVAVIGYFNIHMWQPATCTEPKTCSICGKTEGAALGHRWVEATESAAKTCSVCGSTEGSALEHEWGEPTYKWSSDLKSVTAERVCLYDKNHVESETVGTSSSVIVEPTCEIHGTRLYISDGFKNTAFQGGRTRTEIIPAIGHKWEKATCTTPKTCSVCGKTEGKSLGHSWGEVKYTWSDDCSSVTATRVCLNDEKHVETETVGTTSVVSAEPTCETKGTRVYSSNSFKNSAFGFRSKSTKIPALGHKWQEATVFKPKTCSVCGKTEGAKQSVYVGAYVCFGNYEQDNNKTNGKEPIEWLVLEKDGGKALLISRYALDVQPYDSIIGSTSTTWEKCTLRRWLNETFEYTAFTSEEKEQILTASITADRNPEYDTNPGNNTSDKIFLLSITEVNKYFTSDAARECRPTEYMVSQGYFTNSRNGNCWWWLRSPGLAQTYATYVNVNGSVFTLGTGIDNTYSGIRPALWINLGS